MVQSPSVRNRLALAREVLESHYAQPATAVWRVFEAEVVRENLRGTGRGLDLGCGDGTLAAVLLRHLRDMHWTGLDLDPDDARFAQRQGIYETVHTARADAIPEPDESFDLVFSNSVLEHIPSLDGVLRDVRRVLRPGGRLVFTVPSSAFRGQLLWPRLLRGAGADRLAERYLGALDRRVAHVNYLSQDEWDNQLERSGLQLTRCVPYLSRRVLGAWETIANATGGLAFLAAGGRMTPRAVLQRSGTAGRASPALGRVMAAALAPVLVPLAAERSPHDYGCLYVEAIRT